MKVLFRGKPDHGFGYGYIPGKKRPALYKIDGATITVLAYFSSPFALRGFNDIIVEMLGEPEEKEET